MCSLRKEASRVTRHIVDMQDTFALAAWQRRLRSHIDGRAVGEQGRQRHPAKARLILVDTRRCAGAETQNQKQDQNPHGSMVDERAPLQSAAAFIRSHQPFASCSAT